MVAGDPEFNSASPVQLRKLLFEDLGLPTAGTTGTGLPSTDARSLQAIQSMLESREFVPPPEKKAGTFIVLDSLARVRKLNNTLGFLDSYEELRLDDRIFPNYNQTGTDTTRFSTSRPSLNSVS